MSDTITFTHCPCCSSAAIFPALTAKDHTVSNEEFEIWHCEDCTARFTQKIPTAAAIGPYYQSETYISHSDTGKGFINRMYHIVREHTLKGKRKLIQRVTGKQTGVLLDVGAGTAAFVQTMLTNGWDITGLEPDQGARETAKKKFGIELLPAENLYELKADLFDAITLWHVLEHIHDLHAYLKQFQIALKKNGKLVIAVPNYTSYDAKAYKGFWAAYDVPRHLYHFSPKSMLLLGKLFGFELVQTRPMWYDSFYVSMLSEQYRNGSSNIFGAVWNGMISNIKALFKKDTCSSVIYIFKKV
jgi:SAM-dependent methyltransferase